QRQEYDAIRSMAGGGARFTAGGAGGNGGFEDIFSAFAGGGGGGPRVRYSTGGGSPFGGGGGEPDLEDILSMFGGGGGAGFGGQGAGFRPPPRGPQKGADLTAKTSLSFRDAVEGSTISLDVNGQKGTASTRAGVKEGQQLRLRGNGAHAGAGGPRGDLILTGAVARHPVFERDGNNLVLDLPVTFPEAALGATVTVPPLDGA